METQFAREEIETTATVNAQCFKEDLPALVELSSLELAVVGGGVAAVIFA